MFQVRIHGRGGQGVAFCRIADTPIRLREPIMAPDALIIQDPTLLGAFAALGGLITLDAVQSAIESRFSGAVARGNVAAAAEAYRIVLEAERLAEAQPSAILRQRPLRGTSIRVRSHASNQRPTVGTVFAPFMCSMPRRLQ